MRGREVGIDLLERGGVLAPQVRRCPHAGQPGGDALLGKRGEDGVEVLAHRFWRQAAQAVVGPEFDDRDEIGRASCREGVCMYVYTSVDAVSLTEKYNKTRKGEREHRN